MIGVNLHDVVRGAITYLHPDEDVMLYQFSHLENVEGHITPVYLPPKAVKAQIQSESEEALYHSDRTGQNDISRKFYLYSDSMQTRPAGVIRPLARGGDLIKREGGTLWLITAVPEDFSRVNWTSVRCTLQIDATEPKIIEEGMPV